MEHSAQLVGPGRVDQEVSPISAASCLESCMVKCDLQRSFESLRQLARQLAAYYIYIIADVYHKISSEIFRIKILQIVFFRRSPFVLMLFTIEN